MDGKCVKCGRISQEGLDGIVIDPCDCTPTGRERVFQGALELIKKNAILAHGALEETLNYAMRKIAVLAQDALSSVERGGERCRECNGRGFTVGHASTCKGWEGAYPCDCEGEQIQCNCQAPSQSAEGERMCWFVEEENPSSPGPWWFSLPDSGMGGWATNDPLEARRYTKGEAVAVAEALTYFRVPYPGVTKWKATEHVFLDAANRTEKGDTNDR